MKQFYSLRDESLLHRFYECLQIEKLIQSSVKISTNNIEVEKECVFDFSGISALLLHDKNDKNLSLIQDQIENIFENKEYFNSKKIRLHFRFLLIYPYCAHAIARIQAESSKNRATINQPKLSINQCNIDFVDKQMFDTSYFVSRQTVFLQYIEDLMEKYEINDRGLNRIVIRFVPMAVNVCMYRVNDTIFSIPYLLAKDYRNDKKCVARAPATEINRSNDLDLFNSMLDHFRYLWELPVTLNMQDATNYSPQNPIGLSRIKSPSCIEYVNKAVILNSKQKTKIHSNRPALNAWKVQVKYQLKQLCPTIPEVKPTEEVIFIACSWCKDGDNYSPSSPNNIATKLKKWLENDLAQDLKVKLVDAPGGSTISKEIYDNLNSSTVGIILLTADYKDENGIWYTRPNIYHEFGYLQARFACEGYGANKVIPIQQNKGGKLPEIPSNVKGTAAITLEEDKIEAIYGQILLTVAPLLRIDLNRVCRALAFHKERVKNMILENDIEQHSGLNWLRKLDQNITSYNCKDCSQESCNDRRLDYKVSV